MNLKKINNLIDKYLKLLLVEDAIDVTILSEVQRFHDHWDLDNSDLILMMNKSLNIKSPIWDRQDYHPIQSLFRYININDDLVRSAFKDLFDEKKEIVGRIGRFIFYLNQLEKIDKKNNLSAPPSYQDDRKCAFSFLSFRYPDVYCIYNFTLFRDFMEYISVAELPVDSDLDRFIKVSKTIKLILDRNDSFIKYIDKHEVSKKYMMFHVFELYHLASMEINCE